MGFFKNLHTDKYKYNRRFYFGEFVLLGLPYFDKKIIFKNHLKKEMCAWEEKRFRINISLTIKTGNLKYFSFHLFFFFLQIREKYDKNDKTYCFLCFKNFFVIINKNQEIKTK